VPGIAPACRRRATLGHAGLPGAAVVGDPACQLGLDRAMTDARAGERKRWPQTARVEGPRVIHWCTVASVTANPRPDSRFVRVDGCDLCRAVQITPWYWEDEICWIAECDICEVPMVVWRYHGTEPPAEHVAHMRERLRDVAATRLGEFWVDAHMRNIPDHYHAHARPDGGFFGHGSWRRTAP